jgi:hypothetical protein
MASTHRHSSILGGLALLAWVGGCAAPTHLADDGDEAGETGEPDATDETEPGEPPYPGDSCALETCGEWATTPGLRGLSAYGVSVDEHFFTTADAAMLHYDGNAWARVSMPGVDPEGGDQTIWAAGPSDVYVQDGTSVWHWDGQAFDEMSPTAGSEWIFGIFGFASDDIWIGTSYANGPIQHFDGEQWTRHQVPQGAKVYSLWGAASDDVWANTDSGILHFDGEEWTAMTVDAVDPIDFYAGNLFGTGPDDVWLPLHDGLLHWDGVSWTVVPTARRVSSVWGSSPDNLYALIPDLDYTDQAIVKWNGSEFYSVEIQPLPYWSPYALSGVGSSPLILDRDHIYRIDGLEVSTWLVRDFNVDVGFAPDPSYAIGWGGDDGDYKIFVFENGNWTVVPQFTFPGVPGSAIGTAWDDVWITGNGQYSGDLDDRGTHLYHWDGQSLTREHVPGETEFTGWDVHLIDGDLLLVGDELENDALRVMRRHEGTWTDVTPEGEFGVYRSAASEQVVFVATREEVVLRYADGEWGQLGDPIPNLRSLAVTSDDSVYASTGAIPQSRLFHHDGAGWSELDVAGYQYFSLTGNGRAAWMFGRIELPNGEDERVMYRLDDDGCTVLDAPAPEYAFQMFPTAGAGLFVRYETDDEHSWATYDGCE